MVLARSALFNTDRYVLFEIHINTWILQNTYIVYSKFDTFVLILNFMEINYYKTNTSQRFSRFTFLLRLDTFELGGHVNPLAYDIVTRGTR